MYTPYKGGSSRKIGYDDQWIEVHLPPVGKVFNKFTGNLESRPVLFKNLKPTERYWRREGLPADWKKWKAEEKRQRRVDKEYYHPKIQQFVDTQWDRRINGCWINIYNPFDKKCYDLYLTGLHWFHLSWAKIKGFGGNGYPDFRVIDLDIFQLWAYCEEDPDCIGLMLATRRRAGKTSIAGSMLIEPITRTPQVSGAIQSITKDDAKKVFQNNVMYPFKNLPDPFRPKFNYKLESTLSLTSPLTTSKAALEYDPEEDEDLYSEIYYTDASDLALDGTKQYRVLYEEGGKMPVEWDIGNRHDVVRWCTEENGKNWGMIFSPTTIEEMEKGGANFVKLWERSNFTDKAKSEINETDSGMYNLFIPAHKSYEIDPKYGWTDEEAGLKKILARRATKKDRKTLNAYVRKYPLTWEEASRKNDDECIFNAHILSSRLNEITKVMPKPPYDHFDLRWVNETDGDVEAILNSRTQDSEGGRFKISWLPEPKSYTEKGPEPILNNVFRGEEYRDGKYQPVWYPKNDNLFTIGTDPISFSRTDNPMASKAAAYAFRKFDAGVDLNKPREEWESHNFFVEYLYRPSEPGEYFEDMILLCRFLGCSLLIESQKDNIVQHLENRGYGPFIMWRRDFNSKALVGGQKDTAGVPATAEVIDTYVQKLQRYFERHGHRCPFDALLEQSLRFNSKKTRAFDATVAAGFTLLGLEKKPIHRVEEVEVDEWFEEFEI